MAKKFSDLMAELDNNKEYQEKKAAQSKHFAELKAKYSRDEKQLVEELHEQGYQVESVWDLVNSKNHYPDAESVLVRHLKWDHHPKILSGIARALAVPAFSHNDELWDLLVDLYRKTPPNSKISLPENRGSQHAIAVALSCLATKDRLESLKSLVADEPSGDAISLLEGKIEQLEAGH